MEHVSAVLTAGTSTSSVIVQSNPDDGIALGTTISGITPLHTPPLRTPPPPAQSSQQQTLLQSPLAPPAIVPLSSQLVVPHPPAPLHPLRPPGPSTPVLSPPPKIVGRNHNGTMVTTSTPNNEAELQLYRVLQRASLLSYYDTLLEMGGDDVQQLCDAGEEEFLEIMALVGMATKPLHVRRLQKALHEWVNDPSSFQTPIPMGTDTTRTPIQSPESNVQAHSSYTCPTYSPSSITGSCTIPSSSNIGSVSSLASTSNLPAQVGTTSAMQLSPALSESQLALLTAAAEKISRELPQLEPRAHSSKKRSSKHIEQLLAMSDCDPRRMEEIRKYAAIYGRFDCKRKPEKPLTLHEVCVNEAAAQICKFVPALLTRRDELFPLARQVVRDSGFRHSAEIARFSMGQPAPTTTTDLEQNQAKRQRRYSDASSELSKESTEKLRTNSLSIYQKLGRTMCLGNFPKFTSDFDEDSRFSFSNSSSPPMQSSNGSCYDTHEIETVDEDNKNIQLEQTKYTSSSTTTTTTTTIADSSTLGVHVISASGNQIIAVANPALAMSSTLLEPLAIKRETISPELH